MSEYQFYEFRAIDRPLAAAEMAALRRISTRARITATGFVNTYDWGDLKADPAAFMDRYFDLFVYLANWGSRRFAMRLPESLVSRNALEKFLPGDETAALRRSGEYLVVDVERDEIEADDHDDGHGRLDALAPLRADAIEGDYRVFYLVWLMGVETGAVADDEPEPLPGIAPLTPALEAFADFFGLDRDLVAAAAAAPPPSSRTEAPRKAVETIVRAMSGADKDALLVRLHEGDMRVRAELRRHIRERLASPGATPPALRTAPSCVQPRRASPRSAGARRSGAKRPSGAAASRKRRRSARRV
jgi:hypothetical protein